VTGTQRSVTFPGVRAAPPLAFANVTAAALRRTCLRMPGAAETYPFGERTSVFKVAGKMFALSALKAVPLHVSLKCEPDLAYELRQAHAAIAPGYHLNKRHWNTVTLDGSLPDDSVIDMIEDSYDLVVAALPRATRARLGWAPDELA
jgi:predicted DNA-binding protein (MmcQ/YjbR family)